MSKKTRWKNIAGNCALVVLSILFALLIAEIGLRFTDYRLLLNKAYGFPQGYFVNDPELGTDYAVNFSPQIHEFYGPEYKVFTNSLGCFDWERPVPKDYAIVLGGSSAWGYAPLKSMWTSVLEQKLGWTVLKCAVAGSGTLEQLIKTRRIIAKVGHPPKAIIILYDGPTDVNDDYLLPLTTAVNGCRVETLDYLDMDTGEIHRLTDEEIKRKYGSVNCDTTRDYTLWGKIRKQLTHSLVLNMFKEYIVPYIRQEIRQVANKDRAYSKYDKIFLEWGDPSLPWMQRALMLNKHNLREFMTLAGQINARLLVVDENKDLKTPLMQDILKEIQAANNVYYYDLFGALKPYEQRAHAKYHWKFDPHWNIEGNKLVADLIYGYMQQAGLARPLPELP